MKHNFERIVGTKNKEEHDTASAFLEKRLASDFPERFMECSAEITLEHQKIVQGVIAYAKELLKSLGVDAKVPKLKFILLDREKVNAVGFMGEGVRGKFFPTEGAIAVVDGANLVEFIEIFAHEYFHALGYSSAHVTNGKEAEVYRNGISLHDRNEQSISYFGDLEEAIVTELSMKVLRDAPDASIGNLDLQDQLEHMNTFRTWFNESTEIKHELGENYDEIQRRVNSISLLPHIETVIATIKDDAMDDIEKAGYIDGFISGADQRIKVLPYAPERKKLSTIIEKIIETEPALSSNQVFDEFARAHFSGNYLPIARLIEAAYGKGGFRQIANDTKRTYS